MSIFAKAKKARENKKGFTLVELIVVLVILAILAAMLVPALLGWIDEARNKQFVLEARNVYMATQAYVDEQYAAGKLVLGTDNKFIPSDDGLKRIQKISDAKFTGVTVNTFAKRITDDGTEATDLTDAAEITGMVISSLTVGNQTAATVTLEENGEWVVGTVTTS